MKILALETSTNACSAALLIGDYQQHSCLERFEIAPRQHTALILPMVETLLKEADCPIQNIDALAFGRGPGAFTGVRVATGIVQGIAYGAGIGVAQISSLAGLAQGIYEQHKCPDILVASDARMDEIYFGAYQNLDGYMTLRAQEQVLKPTQLEDYLHNNGMDTNPGAWTMVGNGWSEYAEQLSAVSLATSGELYPDVYPHAKDIGLLAFKEVQCGNLVAAEQVRPVYLRDNVAKKAR